MSFPPLPQTGLLTGYNFIPGENLKLEFRFASLHKFMKQ